jgi:hypothetical protein
MPSNATSFSDLDGDFSDWIEMFNDGSNPVDLTGYFLSDDLRELNKWEFPNSAIDAGEFMVICALGKDIAYSNGELHTNFKLKASGETLYFVMPDGAAIIDQISLPQLPPDISIRKQPDNSNKRIFLESVCSFKKSIRHLMTK